MILLIPEKTDIEFEAVITSMHAGKGTTRKLGKYWVKDDTLTGKPLAIYGNQTFAMVLAQLYEKTLISPDDTLIARLPAKWTSRSIALKQLHDLQAADFPVFIKSVIPKLFSAGVFPTLEAFKQAIGGLADTEEIMTSEIIHPIQAEARSYVMNGEIKDLALYEGDADLDSGMAFLTGFLAEYAAMLPAVVVVDIAFNERTGWFVLEFNACWGAGLNGCKAEKVIDCILAATV